MDPWLFLRGVEGLGWKEGNYRSKEANSRLKRHTPFRRIFYFDVFQRMVVDTELRDGS